MTFDIPFDQPLDARSHGYINLTRENPQLKFSCEPHVFLNPDTSFGTQHQHGSERKVHHLVSFVTFELDQIIMALCRIFDVIKQSSTLQECDMADCLLSKVYATRVT